MYSCRYGNMIKRIASKKPKALILAGYGLNCDEETKFAFDRAGAETYIVHINDAIAGKVRLNDFQIIAIQGGFAYGDDTGSGNAYANKLKNHLWEELEGFVIRDKLVIGICNGFQILVNLGLLPATGKKYGVRQAALLHNDNARYTVRFVDVRAENQSPWLMGVHHLSLPIAHGEGKFFADQKILQMLTGNRQIALKYTRGEACTYLDLPGNPNGSLLDIAGITDPTGRILGLMPHPERAIFFHQLPDWQVRKEKYLRENKELPADGPGMQVFRNAVNYFMA